MIELPHMGLIMWYLRRLAVFILIIDIIAISRILRRRRLEVEKGLKDNRLYPSA